METLTPPALSQEGAFLHTMAGEDREVLRGLTLALNRLAAALEEKGEK